MGIMILWRIGLIQRSYTTMKIKVTYLENDVVKTAVFENATSMGYNEFGFMGVTSEDRDYYFSVRDIIAYDKDKQKIEVAKPKIAT
jgi:hypothetical protein